MSTLVFATPCEPIYYTVRRTWPERLFSWPWKPHQATRQVRDHAAEHAVRVEHLHSALREHHEHRKARREVFQPPERASNTVVLSDWW